jgi:heme/copper-type cytochrome/quinol oxidase subunit 2
MLLLRPLGFDFYGSILPIVTLNSALFFKRSRKFLIISRLNFTPQDTAVVVFAVFFALYLSTPILIIPAILFLFIALRENNAQKLPNAHSSYLLIWITVSLTLGYLSLTTTAPEPFNFGQGAESVPREAWSNSIVMWGPNENIAMFGNPLRYHWFSFAVFGMIARLSGLMPMVLFNSGLSAVVDVICVGGIIWSISYLLFKKKNIALLSVVIVYGAVSLNFPYAIITDSSPDATSWLVWIVTFVFALLNQQHFSPWTAPIFFAAIGTFAILSNGGYGTSLAVGFTFWLFGIVFRERKFSIRNSLNEITIYACTGLAMSVAYFLFLTPSEWSTSTIDISSRFLVSWSGFLFVVSFYSSRIVALKFVTVFATKPFRFLLNGLVVASIAGFFVYRNSAWNLTAYFTLPGLVLFTVPLSIALSNAWSRCADTIKMRNLLVFFSVVLGFSLQLLFSAIQWKHYERFGALVFSEYLVIVPIIAVLVFVALFTQLSKTKTETREKFSKKFRHNFKNIFVISTVTCSLGMGLGYSVRSYTRDLVDLQSGKSISKEASPVVSYELQTAMLWLRSNSSKEQQVATNFLCGSETRSFFRNCSEQNNHLAIAAYAQRRVLIEGNSWSNVGTVFTETQRLPVPIIGEGIFTLQVVAPQWMTERIAMSHRFASRPDKIAADYMKKMGINWFVVDKTKQLPNSWSPYATIAFENSEVIILRTTF